MIRFLTRSVQTAPKVLTVNKNMPLGRWERPSCKQKEDIKVLLANYDCCGDSLCGNPQSLKNDIETILKKKQE